MTPTHGRRPSTRRLRRRTVWTLVAGVALGSTGHIAAVTVATIVAAHIAGTTAWSGAPGAAVVLGRGRGDRPVVAHGRRGRRFGLASGYLIGVLGALVATVAVIGVSLPLLLAGTILIGFGNSSNQLSRYTAADLYPAAGAHRRSASSSGAPRSAPWSGRTSAAPAGTIALAIGLPELTGPYLVPVVFVGAAALLSFVLLRPDPYQLADQPARDEGAEGDGRRRSLRASSRVRTCRWRSSRWSPARS